MCIFVLQRPDEILQGLLALVGMRGPSKQRSRQKGEACDSGGLRGPRRLRNQPANWSLSRRLRMVKREYPFMRKRGGSEPYQGGESQAQSCEASGSHGASL